MTDADDIEAAIVVNAQGPKRVRVGNQEVEQHSIEDQLAAKKAIASEEAAASGGIGMRLKKFKARYE